MSEEVIELVNEIDADNISVQLALQCAPLLADLKISNMFSVKTSMLAKVKSVIGTMPISCYLLRQTEQRTVFLLYHKEKLQAYLQQKEIAAFLEEYGYFGEDLEHRLALFAKRYCDNMEHGAEFPHEIGVFLGYPLEDVKGFIYNHGRNSLCTGYWKVYANKQQKEEMFFRFERAKEFMIRMLFLGNDIKDIMEAMHVFHTVSHP